MEGKGKERLITALIICINNVLISAVETSLIIIIIPFIYSSQSIRDTSIAQLLPVLHWCVRQLRAPLQQNPQRICTNKHFTALGGIHIFAGIEKCAVGGYMVSASRPFLASVILPAWLGLLSLLSQEGAHTSAPHWIRA